MPLHKIAKARGSGGSRAGIEGTQSQGRRQGDLQLPAIEERWRGDSCGAPDWAARRKKKRKGWEARRVPGGSHNDDVGPESRGERDLAPLHLARIKMNQAGP